MGTIGGSLDPRRNGLNALRLLLASLVVVSHAWPLSGHGEDPRLFGVTLGTWAVYGFFVISGYLITGSRVRTSGGRYLWHRALRIFPGLWVCLGVVAAVSLAFPSRLPVVPWLFHNALLSYRSGGGPVAATYPAWDGPLWTLSWEFACYLAVALFALVPLPRRQVAVAATVAAGVFAVHPLPGIMVEGQVLAFMFAVGGCLYGFRERVPDSPWLAALAVLSLPLVALSPVLVAPGLAYLMLWLGAHLRWYVRERRDVSYGVYIYGWPVAQVLIAAGLHVSAPLFAVVCLAATLPVAFLSRLLVESPASRLKNVTGRSPSTLAGWTPAPTATGALAVAARR